MARRQTQSPRPWLAFFVVATMTATMSMIPIGVNAQEREPAPRKPLAFPNSFGRFVNPPAPRISEPTPPRETKGVGGFFMPLKSFSNSLRGMSRSGEDDLEVEQTPSSQPSREPFSDSATDIQVRPQYSQPPRSDRNSQLSAPSTPASSGATPPSDRTSGTVGTGAVRRGAITTGERNPSSEDTTENNAPNVPKTYTAKPKTDNLDSVGTSRKPKDSPVKKQASAEPAPPKDESADSSNSTKPIGAKLSETTLSKSPDGDASTKEAMPSPSKRVESSSSDALGPPLSKSPRGASDQSRSARKPGSVRSKLASSNASSNRPKTQSASNVGLDIHTPGLNLVMTGPDSILVGRAVPYELVATNEGDTPLNGLSIRLIVPANVTIQDPMVSDGVTRATAEESGTGIVWEMSQLPANESRSLKVLVRTEQPEHFAMSLDWKIENPFVQIPIRVQQPQLILALEGTSEADYGRPQTYRLRVRNPGNATAEGVRVLLQAEPNGRSEEIIGDLPAGTERVVEVEFTFQQAGKVPVFAKAISETSNLEASQTIDVEVRQSQLVATWDGPAEFYQGNTGDYTLTLQNRGSIESLDNKCRVTLPEGIEVVTLPSSVSRTENQLLWEVPRIAVGETLEWKFQFAINRSGDLPFSAEATCSTGESTQSTLQTRVDAVADLALSVNDPISPAPVGKPVVYQITITNRGKKVAEDVFVIAQFSDGIEPTLIEGHTGKLVSGQALFDNIPRIEPGQELVLTVTAEASKPGTHRFRAAVRCQGSEDDLLKEESTRYAASASGTSQPK